MLLTKINYREFPDNEKNNYWELKDLVLGQSNLIVGKNATGKTRTVNLASGLAQIINSQKLNNGEFEVEFNTDDNKKFVYELKQIDGKAIYEKIIFDGVVKLTRNDSKTNIASIKGNREIEPPEDKLVLHVRRDKKEEHPFLEYLYEWAANTVGYRFGKSDPSLIAIPGDNKGLLQSLDTVPSIFEKLSQESIKQVIKILIMWATNWKKLP